MALKNGSFIHSEKCLHHLIKHYAASTPQAIALIYQDTSCSYQALDQKSSILANHLQTIGVGKGDFVALHLERSLELIIAIIAIQKAGAAYVPIDINYPKDRIAFMIKDAGAAVVLTQEKYQSNIPITAKNCLCLDNIWKQLNGHSAKYQNQNEPSDIAYMIYTSGSTGLPKGVLISHKNVFNQLEGQQNIAPDRIKKMLLTCSISFDVSVLTIYWAFYQGATLVIPQQDEEKDIAKLAETIARQQISHILTLPSLLTLILEQASPAKLQSLELINVSGEVCSITLVKKHENILPNCQLYNLYGPTEATVNCTFFKIPKGFNATKVPIGRPILNYEIFILNKGLKEVNGDEVGEIYIGGTKPVVGKGYWNRPELSTERFIENPYEQEKGGAILYKTGDLARWMPDGNIEFLGRADFQIKFNGYRIELGEIETALDQYDLIKESVVVLKKDGVTKQERLVAYLSTFNNIALNISDLRTFLSRKLPNYMLPAHFVVLNKMPLTPNGKFDRKALPEPTKKRPQLSQNYQAVQGDLEKYIAKEWEKLLAIEAIGRKDKFFELGGTSILAAQFIGQLQQVLGTSIFITTIFDYPTIAKYAEMLEKDYADQIAIFLKKENKTALKQAFNSKIDFQGFNQFIPKLSQFDTSVAKNPPAIFILAPPRSGTSLLSLMLGSHPDLIAFNEMKLLGFHTLAERAKAYTGKFSLWQEGTIRAIMGLKSCTVQEARSIMQDFEKANGTTKAFFKILQNWAAPKTFIDKTPAYALDEKVLQKIKQDFEKPIFIHLIRHPYATIKSFEKYHLDQVLFLKEHTYSSRELGELIWWQSHQNIYNFLKDIPAPQQFSLQYEALIQNPQAVMKALCQQTGIPFHQNILNPYKHISSSAQNGIHAVSRSMSDSNLLKFKTINKTKATEWQAVEKDNFLSKKTWHLAKQLGYQGPKASSIKKANSQKENTPTNSDIAIIGMACNVPGANTLHEFWLNLVNGTDVSKNVSKADLEQAGLDPTLLDQSNYVPKVLSLDNIDCFDAAFFGYHPKEAALMDPQHRILLELAYNTLENAGYNPYDYEGKIGIFGGVAQNTYFTHHIATHPDLLATADEYTSVLGSEKTFSISKIAYKLNLKGPAVNVQTACSTSGTAIHLACQSIQNGDSDMVLVGGGRVQPNLNAGYEYVEGGPLSPDGYLRAFDADAKGMVRSNGMVCILLKDLAKAKADKDHIWALIKGTAINNDGAYKIGFTAPSPKGQALAIQQALAKAQLKAQDIDYIEAHGTGTILGDPIEVEGLTKAFRTTSNQKQFCALGSVKTAIGHLDAGACVAGIIKTALALKYELLPPSLNFKKPNPQIDFANTPFYVNDKLQRWARGERIRRAGVSSFGLGGSNVHIILEEAPNEEKKTPSSTKIKKPYLFLLSAKSEQTLAEQAQALAAFLDRKSDIDIVDIAFTLATGRAAFPQRKAILWEGKDGFKKVAQKKAILVDAPITFLFPGGGAQYVGMARDLYKCYPYFKAQIDYCLNFLESEEKLCIKNLLFPKNADEIALEHLAIQQSTNALATLFTIEYALAKLWQYWGVQPNVMIGHSMGEYTAACIAGVFSVEDGLRLVVKRGRLFEQIKTEGTMLSVPLSETATQTYLIENTAVSVINKPDNCVVSGTKKAIEILTQRFEKENIDTVPIKINVAAHSPQIDAIIPAFRSFLETIDFKQPSIQIISNLDGKVVAKTAICTPTYWIKHLRQPVRFSDSLHTILSKEAAQVFIEVGPGQTLSTFVKNHPSKTKKHAVYTSIRHPKEKIADNIFILKTLGKLWCQGVSINWADYYKKDAPSRTSLPTYPFERTRHWIDPNRSTRIIKNQVFETTSIPIKEAEPLLEEGINKRSNINRKTHLIQVIKEILFELSGIEPAELEIEASFLELGFDSLFLTQALTKFNRTFNTALTFRQLFEETVSIETLATYLDEHLASDLFTPPLLKQVQKTTQAQNISSPNASNYMQQVVNQQLQIMQQQLDLLKNTGHTNIENTAIVPLANKAVNITKKQKLSSSPKKVAKDKKGFGPWKPIPKEQSKLSNFQKEQLKDFIEKYNEKTKGSKALSQAQRRHLSDPRSIQAFNKLWKDAIYQIAMVRSKGAKMWDTDGNEYIDFLMSFGIGLFGHTPDFVQEAVIEQMKKGMELAALPPLAKEVAGLMCELTGMERVTFVNTGSEAVSAAIRAARTVTGKDKIAVFEGDYHGISDEMLARGIQLKGHTKTVTIAPGIPETAVENVLILYYDDPNLMAVIEDHAADLAAIIIEPIHTQTPQLQRKAIIQKIRAFTKKKAIALIFDELVTGFRLTQKGAQGWYGIEADICAYGKIASGGLPIAMVAGKAKYLDAFDGGQWQYGDASFPEAMITFFGGTFVKHPLSLAAAKAVLEKIKADGPKLQYTLNKKTKAFAERLKALFLKTKAPLAVKSAASILAIKVIDQYPLSNLFFLMMRYKGVYMTERAGFLSLAHTDADLEKVFHVYEAAIEEMFQRNFFKVWEGMDLNEVIDPLLLGLGETIYESKQVPLTEGQKEIWIGHQFSRAAALAYNLSTEIRLEGAFDVSKMQLAIQKLLKRHEALRTIFSKDGQIQIIQAFEKRIIPFIDLSTSNTKNLVELHAEEAETVFDLFEGPLARFKIIRLSDTIHLVFITVHHIIADGWSLGILSTDLGTLYAQEIADSTASLVMPKQLSQYALETQVAKKSPAYAKAENYWLNQYKAAIPVLEFPTDYLRPALKTYDAAMEKLHLNLKTKEQIIKVAAQQGCTFYNFMFAAFHVLIHRLSQQNDFVVGMVAAGQAIAGNKDLVAHSVSLLPLRIPVASEDAFTKHLKKVRGHILDAFEYQNYTLGALVKKLKLPRDPSRQPIVSILFNLDNEFDHIQFGKELKVSTRPISRHYESFDIFINLKNTQNGISFEWIYNTHLFKAATIQRHLATFDVLLQDILVNPTQHIRELSVLSVAEKEKLLTIWNSTNVDNFPSNSIYALFEKQTDKTPDNIALIFDYQILTYNNLFRLTEQFAVFLQKKGIKKGAKVGIYLERSPQMLISLLAVLKLGGIYIPLDPINPSERLQVILEDVEADFLISHHALKHRPIDFKGLTILYETIKTYQAKGAVLSPVSVNVTDLAYIIYTSGSTGKPKGIAIPHYAVIDHHNAIVSKFDITASDRILSVASISFDPSVQDFFMPLFIGASVIIANKETVKDGFLLKALLSKTKATLMQATPSTWQLLLYAGWQGSPHLKVLSGGEGLSKALAAQLLKGNKELWNIYGPTETTIWSTTKQIQASMLTDNSFSYLPVGKPINNVKVYILDKYHQVVPIGVGGDIYIAGIGVAPYGYHNLPELTAKAFIKNPYASYEHDRILYKTGDRGRYLANGDIEYLGRGDKQVKIRGYRIELGDIEATISTYKGVKENRVIVREDIPDDKKLVAYLVEQKQSALDIDHLQQFLKEQLPSYMLPAAYVLMDKFPLTPSKKVDRKQLPAPDWYENTNKQPEVPASTSTEKILEEIWKALLKIEQISIHDDFFNLGGHSLLAVSMMAKIQKEIGRKIPLAVLLNHSTIYSLAKLIDQEAESQFKGSLVPIKTTGSKVPLYLIHGGGLHVLMFQTLAEQMDEDQPIYALQAKGLNGESEPLDRIEDMAAHYISEIQKLNPDGPYALAGYSFGGLIAFEMAKQLEAIGKKVLMLSVFDTVIKKTLTEVAYPISEKIALTGKKVAWNLKDLFQNPSNSLSYHNFLYRRRLNQWKYKIFKNTKSDITNYDPQLEELVNKSNYQAWHNYTISPYQGNLYLFRAEEQRFFLDDKKFLGWKPYIQGKIRTLVIPGDHLSLFNPPNGGIFAQKLQKLLNQLQDLH